MNDSFTVMRGLENPIITSIIIEVGFMIFLIATRRNGDLFRAIENGVLFLQSIIALLVVGILGMLNLHKAGWSVIWISILIKILIYFFNNDNGKKENTT